MMGIRHSLISTIVVSAGLLVALPCLAGAEELGIGNAVVTSFSGERDVPQTNDLLPRVIDPQGVVVQILDIGASPSDPNVDQIASGRPLATAADVGQVFGIALDDATPPNVYLGATSLYALARSGGSWMDGQWGPGGGPGTIWKLDSADGFRPSIFADVSLGDRQNSGAGLGNLAYDPWHRQLIVSDLETGMIHAIGVDDGQERDRYDHGLSGRSGFVDIETGEVRALSIVEFDPASKPMLDECQSGPIASTPQCWNLADFRRRVFGLAVGRDERTNAIRVYYATWADTGFGNSAFEAAATDEKANAVWSVELDADGHFKPATVEREFVVPAETEHGADQSDRFAITDIAFQKIGDRTFLAVARNRGRILGTGAGTGQGMSGAGKPAYGGAENMLWSRNAAGNWVPTEAGVEPVRPAVIGLEGRPTGLPVGGDAAGGTAFGFGYRDGRIDLNQPAAAVWQTAGNLCAEPGACAANTVETPVITFGLAGMGPIGDLEIVGPSATAGEAENADVPDWGAGGEAAWWPGNAEEQGWWPEAPQPGTGPKPGPQPAPGGFPDLAVQKVVPSKCQPGKVCTIVAILTNVGTEKYVAPVRVTDDLANNWKLASAGPAGSPWTCAQSGTLVTCAHPLLDVAPGAHEVLAFDVEIPAGQVPGVINNCALLEHGPGAVDADPANDQGCTQLTFDGSGQVQPDYDLAIEKEANGECIAGQHCLFVLRIKNAGTTDFNGDIAYVDILPAGWKLGDIKPGWWCMLTAGGGDRFSCSQKTKLVPGQTEITMFTAFPPADFVGGAENCAELDWTKAQKDQFGNNDRACAKVDVKAPPPNDLAIDKRFGGQGNLGGAAAGSAFVGGCQQGTECAFDIVVSNNGPGNFDGLVTVVDEMPPGWKFAKASPGWTCVMAVSQPLFSCQKQVSLAKDAHDVLTLNMIPNYGAAAVEVTNCVSLNWDKGKPDGDPGNDRSCLPLQQAAGKPDLIIRKTGPETCERGGKCAFDVEVENIGSVAYNGALWLAEQDDDVFAIAGYTSTDQWICAARHRETPAPGKEKDLQPGRIDCLLGQVDLAPGKKTRLHLELVISELLEKQRTHYQNCVKFGADHDKDGIDEVGCHTVRLVPDWDLKITKTARSMCYGLKTDVCDYAYTVSNLGPGEYEGPVSIVDEYATGIGLELSGWSPQAPKGWACNTLKEGELRCDHPTVKLKAGESMKDILKLVMRFTKDSPENLEVISNRATVKYIGGPPDGDISNDSATATVVINHSSNRTVTGSTKICSAFDIVLAFVGQGTTCYKPSYTPKLDVNGDGTVECRGPACTFYEFTIVNSGASTYSGDMSLAVTLPEGARFISAKGTKAGLACKAERWSCEFNVNRAVCKPSACVLATGEETAVHFEVKLLPTPAPAIPEEGLKLTTCADLTWQTPPPSNPIEQRASETSLSRACRTTLVLPEKPKPCPVGEERDRSGRCVVVAKPLDLAISKRTVGNCDGKENCRFQITVSSQGNDPPAIPVSIRDTFSIDGATLDRVSGEASCTQSGLTINCLAKPGALAKNRDLVMSLDMSLPRRGGGHAAENCAEISWPGVGDLTLSRDEIRLLQTTLLHLGYDPGPVDGVVGRKTREASAAAMNHLGLKPGMAIDRILLTRLLGGGTAAADDNPANDRSCLTIVLPECRPGYSFVRGSGECVCPPPTVERDDECVTIATPTPVSCENGSVNTKNQCVCPSGWSRERVASNRYRCNPPAKQITVICEGGSVNTKNQCICPSGWSREKTGSNRYRCNPPAKQITVICDGGSVNAGNQCVCPSGWSREKTGSNRYRCNPPAKQVAVICEGGSVNARNQCVCPRGWNVQGIARNHYRCNPPVKQVTVICEGGSVNARNQCVCPRGWNLQGIARNHYRCNPPPAPNPQPLPIPKQTPAPARIQCIGGQVLRGLCICPPGLAQIALPNGAGFSCTRLQMIQPKVILGPIK